MARNSRRDLKKEEVWRRRLRGQAASGLSIRGWCQREGLRETAFHWWRRELAQRAAETPGFAPVRVVAEPTVAAAGHLEIVLPGECRVHVSGPVARRTLTDVLAVLNDMARAVEAPRC